MILACGRGEESDERRRRAGAPSPRLCDRPGRKLRLLGSPRTETALALVYAAGIGAWSHLVGRNPLHAFDLGAA